MTRSVHIDFETRATVDLKKTGAYVYFDDPDTDVWCAAYAFDDEPVEIWKPGEPCPPALAAHIEAGGRMVAHNAAFERLCFMKIMGPRYGWPVPRTEQWYCTMAMALAQALPGSLEGVAAAVNSPIQKDDAGARVMKQMMKPRRKGQIEGVRHFQDPFELASRQEVFWWDQEEKRERLYAYCKTDVEAEREVEKRILPLNDAEQRLWWLDQEINDRGITVDAKLCVSALSIVDDQRERLDREMRLTTLGEVVSTTAVAQIKGYLRDAHGVDVDAGLDKSVVASLLIRDDLPQAARKVLELRKEGSRASVSKIEALLNGMQADGRTRGLLQYHAATTGRWGGRRFQPQNIKRPDLDDVDTAIKAVATGNLDLVIAMYGDALSAIGDCLRGMIKAGPGKVLCAADFANIEGRVLAWAAGEDWKLDAFRAFDTYVLGADGQRQKDPQNPKEWLRAGPDLYKLAYSRAFQIPVAEVTKLMRQIGKVMELALGYQGGVGAFQTMAAGYGVRIGEQHDFLVDSAPVEVMDLVNDAWRSRGRMSGIDKETWIAAEIVKVLWRASHPATVTLWRDMEDAAIEAVRRPGTIVKVGRLAFRTNGSFLFMRLPSGRLLSYAFPKLAKTQMPWTDKDGAPVFKDQVRFKGVDSTTKQWVEQSTYGGKLTENAVQAIARDVLVAGIWSAEAGGFPTLLHVHDEAVSEIDEDFASEDTVKEYEELLCALPAWAEGLPVVAEGWIGERYRK